MLRAAIVVTTVALSVAKGFRAAPTVEPVVSSLWLSQHLHDPDLVLVQAGPRDDYDKGHIAGTRYQEGGLESDDPKMDMAALPSAASVRARLEKLGVSDRSHLVVVYIGKGIPWATRVIYLAHYAGFDNISLLDGGMPAWQRAGLPLTRAVPVFGAGKITAAAPRSDGVDRAWVQAHLNSPHVRIIDARDTSYFSGPPVQGMAGMMAMPAGHIPGAHNVPHWSLFTDAGMLLSPAEIGAKFRAAGLQPGDTVIAYCHVGVQATAVVFAARLAGYPAKMYVGSFHDWSAHNMPTEGGKP